MAGAANYLPYILGALGGGGVICAWYGLQRLRREKADKATRRLGLILVNAGIIMVALSLYLISAAS